jgi:ribosomal-protein-alanine N-acetyltransferase
MSRDDVDAVNALESRSFSSPWPKRSFELALRDPSINSLVALDGGLLVGYLIAVLRGRELLVANLAVREDRRRRGVACRLLQRALVEGYRRNAAYALLDVRESNQAAIHLYQGLGFEVIGRRQGYYLSPVENALVMKKRLGPPAGL